MSNTALLTGNEAIARGVAKDVLKGHADEVHWVEAIQGGFVSAGYDGEYGNCVEIDHGGGLSTKFAHLSKIEVAVGQTVDRGRTVGRVGSTGRSTGSHLHYEVHVNDQPVNPVKYLSN